MTTPELPALSGWLAKKHRSDSFARSATSCKCSLRFFWCTRILAFAFIRSPDTHKLAACRPVPAAHDLRRSSPVLRALSRLRIAPVRRTLAPHRSSARCLPTLPGCTWTMRAATCNDEQTYSVPSSITKRGTQYYSTRYNNAEELRCNEILYIGSWSTQPRKG
jgi:hypothetical protein